MSNNYCTIHPHDQNLPDQFFYGNMKVTRKALLDDSKTARSMKTIFESYQTAGIFPAQTKLTGDYLEHFLVRQETNKASPAGRYLGIIFPDSSYQYVRIESESIGIKKRKPDQFDEINILTDTCLFCAANATATLKTGEIISIVAPQTKIKSPIIKLDISERMCPYEMDSIIRLTNLIGAIKESAPLFKKAILAMPTVEYYFYLIDAYNNRFIEKGMMQDWIEQVNRHSEKVINALSKRIDFEIAICQPLQHAEPYIRNCVDRGNKANFEKTIGILSTENELWKMVLPITKPRQWQDLNYTNYAIAVLESSRVNDNANALTIDIENPSEQRILRNASKIAKKLETQGSKDKFRVIGIYPHEKVFFSASNECSGKFPRLYYMNQNEAATTGHYREIVEANQRKVIY